MKSHDPGHKVIAKGLYFICSHQSKVKFPQLIAGHFMSWFEVRHCNIFTPHCISTDWLIKSIWMYYEWSRGIEAVGYNTNKLQGQGEYVYCEMDNDDVSQTMKHTTASTGTANHNLPFMEISQLHAMHDEEASKYKVQDTYRLCTTVQRQVHQ